MEISREELEGLIDKVLASQQPFFTGFLNQIAAHDSEMSKIRGELMLVRDLAHQLSTQELHLRLKDQEKQIEALEAERHQRIGAIKATEWLPKIVGYLAILIGGIIAYMSGKGMLK